MAGPKSKFSTALSPMLSGEIVASKSEGLVIAVLEFDDICCTYLKKSRRIRCRLALSVEEAKGLGLTLTREARRAA